MSKSSFVYLLPDSATLPELSHKLRRNYAQLRQDLAALQTGVSSATAAGGGAPLLTLVKTITDSPFVVPAGNAAALLAASASAAANFIAQLPAATGSGNKVGVSKRDANAHNIAVTPNGADTINDAGVYNISVQYAVVWFVDFAAGKWMVG